MRPRLQYHFGNVHLLGTNDSHSSGNTDSYNNDGLNHIMYLSFFRVSYSPLMFYFVFFCFRVFNAKSVRTFSIVAFFSVLDVAFNPS